MMDNANTINGGSSTVAPEPKPFNFFIFDKPFIEHEELYSRNDDDDEDFMSGEIRKGQRLAPSRQPAEFCSVKCEPSFIGHRKKARILPICCRYCLPKAKMQIAEVNKEKTIENCLTVKSDLKSDANYWYTKWVPNVLKYLWKRSSIVKQYDIVTFNDIKNDPELLQNVADCDEMNVEEQHAIRSKILSFVEKLWTLPMNRLRFMLSSWAVRLFLKCIFGAVFVHTGQIEHLKMTQDKGLPMVFIPLYRSVLDPIVLYAVLTHYNIPSPFFFSDNIMSNDSLLRKLTGFTGVRLEFKNEAVSDELALKNDIIYAGVSAYLRLLLKKSNNCQILVEPNRSKSGLPSTYLYGSELVEILINLFESKQLEDAYIVPMCATYEKLPEGDEYLTNFNTLNQKVNDISYLNLFWKCLRKPSGNIRVDFGQPFSLREFELELKSTMKWAQSTCQDGHYLTIQSSDLRWNTNDCPTSSLPSFYGNLYNVAKDLSFVNLLANHAIYDASKCGAIMSTHILSFFLVKKYQNGLYLDKLIEEFKCFQLLAEDVNRDLGFRGNMEDVILRAIHILGPNLISVAVLDKGKFIKAVNDPEVKLQLCYYANHVTPMFALEAVFATTLFSLFGNTITIPAFVNERVVSTPVRQFARAFREVYKYLKAELFIHPPCKSPDGVILMCLDEFQARGHLFVVEKKKHKDRYQQESEDDWDSDPGEDPFEYNYDDVLVTLNHDLINDDLIFWKNLVVGYLEVYRTSCLKFFEMLPRVEIEEQCMLNQMLEFSFKYSRRQICEDVLSSNTVQNFVNRMIDLNVVGYYNNKKDKKRYFFLMDDYASSDAIEKLYKTFDGLVFHP